MSGGRGAILLGGHRQQGEGYNNRESGWRGWAVMGWAVLSVHLSI